MNFIASFIDQTINIFDFYRSILSLTSLSQALKNIASDNDIMLYMNAIFNGFLVQFFHLVFRK
jgi:hypothetical protein